MYGKSFDFCIQILEFVKNGWALTSLSPLCLQISKVISIFARLNIEEIKTKGDNKMKKFLVMIMFALTTGLFVACDDDHDRYYDYPWDYGYNDRNNPYEQSLSQNEQKLVGSYVSADGKTPIYFVLNSDRTGYYSTNGSTFQFKWVLQNNTLYLKGTSTNKNETYTVSIANNKLYLNNIPFVNLMQSALTDAEKSLIGSFVTDDGKEPIYLVLNDNRTGTYTSQGQSVSFQWYVLNNTLYMIYSDNTVDSYTIKYQDNRLYLNNIPFVTYKAETQSPLVNQWEGQIDATYYTDVYTNFTSEGKYATICEYFADGTGIQLDYDVDNPKDNYSYQPFNWVINGRTISVSYSDDSKLTSASYDNYILTDTQFKGKVSLSGFTTYSFGYTKTSGFDWGAYQTRLYQKTTRSGVVESLMTQLRQTKAKASVKGCFK